MAISKLRLIVNGVGTFAITAFFLPIGLAGLGTLMFTEYRMGSDPDGMDKVIGAELFSLVVGLLALASFIRTVMTWRRARREGATGQPEGL